MDLASIVNSEMDPFCGSYGFRLESRSKSELVEVTTGGLVTMKEVKDESF